MSKERVVKMPWYVGSAYVVFTCGIFQKIKNKLQKKEKKIAWCFARLT